MNNISALAIVGLAALLLGLVPFVVGFLIQKTVKRELPAFAAWFISAAVLAYTSYLSPKRGVNIFPKMAEDYALLKFGIFMVSVIVFAMLMKEGFNYARKTREQQGHR
jgi:hypothetical protein